MQKVQMGAGLRGESDDRSSGMAGQADDEDGYTEPEVAYNEYKRPKMGKPPVSNRPMVGSKAKEKLAELGMSL